jgi:hypothetical protein
MAGMASYAVVLKKEAPKPPKPPKPQMLTYSDFLGKEIPMTKAPSYSEALTSKDTTCYFLEKLPLGSDSVL